jgi:hypothetical protein
MTAEAGAPDGRTACTVDELLIEARSSLPRRPSPAEALAAQATGALLIDIRGAARVHVHLRPVVHLRKTSAAITSATTGRARQGLGVVLGARRRGGA